MPDTSRATTALITGCGRKRIGHVVAQHLASRGWNIAVHYNRSKELANENVETYRRHDVRAKAFQSDVTNERSVKQLVADVVQEFAGIELLVTTASIWRSIPLENVTASDVMRSFEVNTLGTFLCCQHVGLQMVSQQTGGNIITIGDSLDEHPYIDHAPYFTAKGSIASLTRAFAVELAERNPKVRVNCIAPGPVMFPDSMSAEQADRVTASTLVQQANHPQSIANAVEFLVTTPMATGMVMRIDGGRNVGREQQMRNSEANDVTKAPIS